MQMPKTFADMSNRIAHQIEGRLKSVDLDTLLGGIGLQVAKRSPSIVLPLVIAFGSGVAFGAIFSPTSGHELRARIGKAVTQVVTAAKSQLAKRTGPALGAEGETAGSPYGKALQAETVQAEQRAAAGGNEHTQAIPPSA